MEKNAIALKNAGEWQDAAYELEQILEIRSDWEHGYGWFNLAECYEEGGRISDARIAYQQAAHTSPRDPILLGGFASFLFLHGEAEEAFDEYIRLLALDNAQGDTSGAATTMLAITSLGSRLAWPEEDLANQIRQKLAELATSNPN